MICRTFSDSVKTGIFSSGITHSYSMRNLVRPPQVRAGHIRCVCCRIGTGGPAVLNSVSCVAHLPQSPVRLLNHFIQQFFWEDTTTSAILSSCLWIFPDSFSGTEPSHVHHAFFVAPGHFSAHQDESFMLNPGGLEGGLRKLRSVPLGLLSSKNCTCCSFQPSQLSTWRRRTSISAPG